MSLADRDKAAGLEAARRFVELGFSIAATSGTAAHLEANRVPVATVVAKVGEGTGQDAVDLISSGKVDLVVNSPRGRGARADGIAHPLGCERASGPVPHDGCRGPRGGERHDRVGRVRSPRHVAARAPRRHRRSARAPDLMTVDLTSTIGSIELPNPVMTASGCAGHGDELGRYFPLSELGAVVVKSLAAFEWPGNPAPRLHPVTGGMLNSVGLQGPGVAKWLRDDLPRLERAGARVVASIWGRTVDDYGLAAKMLVDAPACVVAVEVNLSCPNLDGGAHLFAHSPEATAEALARRGDLRAAGLGEAQPEHRPARRSRRRAAQAAGADAVTLVNTVLGMVDRCRDPSPGSRAGGGGLSGRAIHPVAVRAVHDVHAAVPDLPIVGVGGVANGPMQSS